MASVTGGESNALKGPEFVVKGATDFDQRWIDETTEAGIAALGWKRPEPRPPEWDKPLSRDVAQAAPRPASVAKQPQKKRLRDRVRRLLHRGPAPVEGG
ncbi:hypothetical protein [Bradyrhizobium sp. USDA 3311]